MRIEITPIKESDNNKKNQEGVRDTKKTVKAIITSPKKASMITLIRVEILIRPKIMDNFQAERIIDKSIDIRFMIQ